MDFPNRRALLAAAAALGATAAASAQDRNEPVIGNKGGSILGPRNRNGAAEPRHSAAALDRPRVGTQPQIFVCRRPYEDSRRWLVA